MTRFRILLTSFIFLLVFSLSAQGSLDGSWEGFMTVGGIYSNEQLPMQLYLTSEGRKVKGRSYVQLPDGSTLRMDLEGYRYKDLSISLTETSFAGDVTNDIMPEFNRQYQIVFKPDLWDPHLRGYWQEETDEAFLPKRRRGRMRLTRQKKKGV
ncbi:hypothetical protein FUA23_05990 [Neolewinella aurantiaca]|uniref:Uncharacterized protein n=1 Tax=Neolewinella aurantiaca TaxID=2602767 RepID=A0A5C7FL04_9BACT|nr:hypothetical protein [Neolewinella aurantiaca]TXF90643.1 hypothetical protein FUA23_05990 [Neolewinella aurantiaca]